MHSAEPISLSLRSSGCGSREDPFPRANRNRRLNPSAATGLPPNYLPRIGRLFDRTTAAGVGVIGIRVLAGARAARAFARQTKGGSVIKSTNPLAHDGIPPMRKPERTNLPFRAGGNENVDAKPMRGLCRGSATLIVTPLHRAAFAALDLSRCRQPVTALARPPGMPACVDNRHSGGEAKCSNVLESLPKSWLRGAAHSSICIQEGQPIDLLDSQFCCWTCPTVCHSSC
jgi:hypothetical protein